MNGRLIVLGLLIICIAAGKKLSIFLFIFACTFNVIPVCGSNGQSYGNECLLCREIETNKEILVAKDGTC
uniref:Kazal-like domain-containing protein n=1 Tax=Poecilia mexicana TaxID=48701 RepID=A0A3B3YXM1_9TELE